MQRLLTFPPAIWSVRLCKWQHDVSGNDFGVSCLGLNEWHFLPSVRMVVIFRMRAALVVQIRVARGLNLWWVLSPNPVKRSFPNVHLAMSVSRWWSPFPVSLSIECCTKTGSLLGNLVAGKLDSTCLVDPDPNRQTIQLSMCGNGIVERGEECDPGVGIESACCNSTTCKLLSNASCDPRSSPCCTDQCSFAPSTQMCRPSMDARCDTPEFCTGNSSSCPADSIAPNGKWGRRARDSCLLKRLNIQVKVAALGNLNVQVVHALPLHVSDWISCTFLLNITCSVHICFCPHE